ncbi:MAG: PKD-like domain-containing protein, partial [Bacteroidota bacterium]
YTVTPGSVINQVLNNSSFVAETVTYHLTPTMNNCQGTTYNFIVSVNPVPYLTTNPLTDSICSGTPTGIHLTGSTALTNFTWTSQVMTGSVTGHAGGTGDWIIQTLDNLINTTGLVKYTISLSTSLCSGIDTSFRMYVYPKPHVTTSPLLSTLCSGALLTIPLTSEVSSAQFFWSATASSPNITGYTAGNGTVINQVINNSGYTTETVTYRIIPRVNGCNGDTATYVVTVFPVPNAFSQPAGESICSGSATNLALQSNVTGTTFTWSASGSSPNVSGFSAGNNSTIIQTLANSGTTTETVTYTITSFANGCPAGPAYIALVNVYPVSHLSNLPLSHTQCNNTLFNLNLTATVNGSTFSWSCSPGSPNISGYSAGAGNTINQTLTNSGFTPETIVYHITPAANNCQGPVTDYAVTISPTPNLSNSPAASQVCNNSNTGINLTSNVTGTTFTWTCTPSSGNVTGWSNNGVPSSSINQVLSNASLNVETVTYHLTPHANGCDGAVTNFIVSVVSSPNVIFTPPLQTICSQQTSNIQITSGVPLTTFTWSASSSSPNLSGYSGGAGNQITQNVVNAGITIETVTYTVVPTAWGCPSGLPQSVVLTVNPKPVITNNNTALNICSLGTASITFQSNILATTFSWIATGSSPNVTGFSNGSAPSVNQLLTNTGFNDETVTYKTVPLANNCPGDTVAFLVTVHPVANVLFTPVTEALCPQQTSNIAISSSVSATTFSWSANGSSSQVSGYSAGAGNVIQQTLNNTGYANETVTYHVSPTAKGCAGIAGNVIVTVHPAPAVSFVLCNDPVTTSDAQPFQLKGGSPLGGTYSGRGVNSGVFYPAIAGPGIDTITYAYTNMYSCPDSRFLVFTVSNPTVFTCGNALTDIRDNHTYPTILLGTQCWMTTNLDYGNYITSSFHQRDNCSDEKYCRNDLQTNCITDGGLYQWDEMMRYDGTGNRQGFCPPSWHIPSESEWNTLFNHFISNGFAGSPLKYSGFSGFNALLNGANFKIINWNFYNFATFYWSSNPHGTFRAWAHGMNEFNPSVSFYPAARSNAFPVRCLKD